MHRQPSEGATAKAATNLCRGGARATAGATVAPNRRETAANTGWSRAWRVARRAARGVRVGTAVEQELRDNAFGGVRCRGADTTGRIVRQL